MNLKIMVNLNILLRMIEVKYLMSILLVIGKIKVYHLR